MFKRVTSFIAILMLGLFVLAGCGKEGIEGTWVLTKEIDAAGVSMSGDELSDVGVAEQYEITGNSVVYTLNTTYAKQPIVIDLELKDLGGGQYEFNLPSGGYTFATVTVKGNTMTYEVGEDSDKMTMVFKRK